MTADLSRPPPTALRQPRGSNHVGMRQFNERVVLQAIRLHGSLPKADLARLTGLTAQTGRPDHHPAGGRRPAAAQERRARRIGQPSVPLALNPTAPSIGIKIGRRSMPTAAGRLHRHGAPALDAGLPLPGPRQPAAEIGAPAGMGMAAQGLGALGWARAGGRGRRGAVPDGRLAPHAGPVARGAGSAWNQIDLRAEVQAMTDLPVSLIKDTAAACVAELVAGRGRRPEELSCTVCRHLCRRRPGHQLAPARRPARQRRRGRLAAAGLAGGQGTAPEQLISRRRCGNLEQRLPPPTGWTRPRAYDERALQAPFDAHQPPGWPRWPPMRWRTASSMAWPSRPGRDRAGRLLLPPVAAALIGRPQQALGNYNWEGMWPAP
jgi:hypothetical protein